MADTSGLVLIIVPIMLFTMYVFIPLWISLIKKEKVENLYLKAAISVSGICSVLFLGSFLRP